MKYTLLLTALLASPAYAVGYIQNVDIATPAQIVSAGGANSQAINTSNLWEDTDSVLLSTQIGVWNAKQAALSNQTCSANNFVSSNTGGTFTCTQPAASGLSGAITNAQMPTYTANGLTYGTGSAGLSQVTVGTTGTILKGTSAAAPSFTATPVLGAVGTTGTLGFSGTTSGVVTVQPQAAAGTYNFNLPITAGTAGQLMTSQAGGATAMSWTAAPTATPTASNIADWDANKAMSGAALIPLCTSTATAAGTTTLVVGTNQCAIFTGATTQTVVLPVVTTLANGRRFTVYNQSSGVVTVQTSGSNVIQAMAANTQLDLVVQGTALGTGTASWAWKYSSANSSTILSSILPSTQSISTLSNLTSNGFVTTSGGTGALSVTSAPSGTVSQLLANNGSGGFSNVTIGSNLTYSAGTLSATGGGGGSAMSVLTKTAGYSVVSGDFTGARLLLVANCSAACTMTLPASNTVSGYEINVINTGTAVATVSTNGTDTFGSSADTTWTLIPGGSPQASNKFIADGGTSWAGF